MGSPQAADPPDLLRQFFFEYATSVDALARKSRWYRCVTRNCTTARYAQARGFGDYLRAHLPGYAAANEVATT